MGRPRTVSDDDVLAAAAAVLARHGPGGTTLAAVGAAIGLSPAALVKRFGSKRDLLLALARQGAENLPRRIAVTASTARPVEAIVDALTALAGGVRSREEFSNHLAFLLLDLSDPQFREITREFAVGTETALTQALRAAQEQGQLNTATDVADLARAVHAMYNGALLTWGMSGDGALGEHVRKQLEDLLRPYQALSS
jgi:AcrR family transcriptional regulator